MKYDRLLQCFEEIASGMPEDWDNSGIQIRTDKEEIERVLVCLEVTPEVIREAMELETDLIIAHHPLIFGGVEHLNTEDVHEKMILDLVAAGIDVYAAHITFDKAPLGNSFFLADLLGFDDLVQVEDLPLVVGRLQPSMTLGELFLHTADMMDLRPGQIRAAGDRSQQIYRAAVCTGAGSEFMEEALAAGCLQLGEHAGKIVHGALVDVMEEVDAVRVSRLPGPAEFIGDLAVVLGQAFPVEAVHVPEPDLVVGQILPPTGDA